MRWWVSLFVSTLAACSVDPAEVVAGPSTTVAHAVSSTTTTSSTPQRIAVCAGNPVDVDLSRVLEIDVEPSTFAAGASVPLSVAAPDLAADLVISSSINVTCWTGEHWVAAWQTTIDGQDPRLSNPNETMMTMHADAVPLPVDVEIRIPKQTEPGMYRAWLSGWCLSCERPEHLSLVVDFEVVVARP